MVEPHGSIFRVITTNFWVSEYLGNLRYAKFLIVITHRNILKTKTQYSKSFNILGNMRSIFQKRLCVIVIGEATAGVTFIDNENVCFVLGGGGWILVEKQKIK